MYLFIASGVEIGVGEEVRTVLGVYVYVFAVYLFIYLFI
jgi:hypothetical protein